MKKIFLLCFILFSCNTEKKDSNNTPMMSTSPSLPSDMSTDIPEVKPKYEECKNLEQPQDGIPMQFYILECEGRFAMEKKDYAYAEQRYLKALEIPFFEAPNYDLLIEYGMALCKQGKIEQGKKQIQQFICVSSMDMGELKCDSPQFKEICPEQECFEMEYGSGLAAEGIQMVKNRQELAKKSMAECEK
jgi:hypothetical protein